MDRIQKSEFLSFFYLLFDIFGKKRRKNFMCDDDGRRKGWDGVESERERNFPSANSAGSDKLDQFFVTHSIVILPVCFQSLQTSLNSSVISVF